MLTSADIQIFYFYATDSKGRVHKHGYLGDSMESCLKQLQSRYGPDAVIEHIPEKAPAQ